jgi:4-amino-4-deoxy-L-arabinose transferase-like glycosyltransferase
MGDVMRTRHLITFLYCFIGYLCFYALGKRVFQNRWIALLGSVMLYLYPRFFATQFFYIKDMLFVASFMAAMWATVLLIEREGKPLYGLLFCFVAAICANVRFIGMIFPALVIGYWLFETCSSAKCIAKASKPYCGALAHMPLWCLAFLRSMWQFTGLLGNAAPLYHCSYQDFLLYDTWQGSTMFMGQWVPWNDVPWYFIPYGS